jgi:hypothetical protein
MGAHFYCITIGGLAWRKTVWPGEPIEREKGSIGGGWVVVRASSQILGASFAKSADDAAQLLGQPATGEPYTIQIITCFNTAPGIFWKLYYFHSSRYFKRYSKRVKVIYKINNITKIQNVTPFRFKLSYCILYFTIGYKYNTKCPLGNY